MRLSYIKIIADRLVEKYKSRDPFELADALGIEVRFYDFDRLKGFYTCLNTFRYIGINRNLSEIEQNLCCGHELGHDLLHRYITNCMTDYNLFTNVQVEHEANVLAAHLLIPDDLVYKYRGRKLEFEKIGLYENLYPELLRLKFNLSIF